VTERMPRPEATGVRPGSGAMFDAIAPRYDLLNRLLSLGIDQSWRTRAVEALRIPKGGRVLDLATGTADLALRMLRHEPSAEVVGLDPSQKMLEAGRKKIAEAGLGARIELVLGDAETLPFAGASFDAVSIAFGIRNVPNRSRALSEMRRVTRPGGRVVVLELSEPRGFLSGLAKFHVHTVVPNLGALLSGAREYRYLEQSIAAFPPPEVFAELMKGAGLTVLETVPLTFGVCHLYVAGVPR